MELQCIPRVPQRCYTGPFPVATRGCDSRSRSLQCSHAFFLYSSGCHHRFFLRQLQQASSQSRHGSRRVHVRVSAAPPGSVGPDRDG